MNEPETITVCKAAPGGEEPVRGIIISITGEPLADPTYDEIWLGTWSMELDEQAGLIERALYQALSGGVYDKLAVRMMSRRCSQLRVAHGQREGVQP